MIFKYLGQEFVNNVLEIFKQKGSYAYEYMVNFETFKEELPSKETFFIVLWQIKNSDKEYEHFLITGKNLK